MSAKVAVVIPAYRAADKLAPAIESVKAQRVDGGVELVVVDDGSDDDTAAVAERLGARCLRQQNAGPGAARNHGVRATRAPWIAFLDADDWFAEDKLARQLAHLDAAGAGAGCTDARIVRDGALHDRKNARRRLAAEFTVASLLDENPVVCSSVMLRREVFEAAGGFDEDRRLIATEDYDLWLRVAEQGPMAYLDEPLTFYAVHGDSLSDNARFMAGVDLILEKFRARAPAVDAALDARIRRRRGRIRLDRAWDAIQAGQRREARDWIAQARSLGAGGWLARKMWLRTFV